MIKKFGSFLRARQKSSANVLIHSQTLKRECTLNKINPNMHTYVYAVTKYFSTFLNHKDCMMS